MVTKLTFFNLSFVGTNPVRSSHIKKENFDLTAPHFNRNHCFKTADITKTLKVHVLITNHLQSNYVYLLCKSLRK